jgi:hypothetical protein
LSPKKFSQSPRTFLILLQLRKFLFHFDAHDFLIFSSWAYEFVCFSKLSNFGRVLNSTPKKASLISTTFYIFILSERKLPMKRKECAQKRQSDKKRFLIKKQAHPSIDPLQKKTNSFQNLAKPLP